MLTPEFRAAWQQWKAAREAVQVLIAAGGGGDRDAFWAAIAAANDAGEKLQAARRRALS